MFIDDVNNRYTYLNSLKNIVHEEPLERTPNPERLLTLDDGMVLIINKLTKERPTWRFKSTERRCSGPGTHLVKRFTIYDGDEQLGQLWLDHHWRDSTRRFYFDNFRLAKERQRSHENFTTKPDVAAKRILKTFHLKTPSERAAEAFGEARGAINAVANGANWPLRKAKAAILEDLFGYAIRNWETVKQHLSMDAKLLDMPALVEADKEGSALHVAFTDNAGVIVRVETNSTYLTARSSDGGYEVQAYTDSTLPDHLAGALGLLKLMDDGSHIAGVGVRAKRNLYFVMDKKEAV